MAPNHKKNKSHGAKTTRSTHTRPTQDVPESKPTINNSTPQTPTTTIPVKGERSLSPTEIKHEFKRDEDENTGERKLSSDGREEGNDTDFGSQAISQPAQTMKVDNAFSSILSDITTHDDNGQGDSIGKLDPEALQLEINRNKAEVARNDAEVSRMDARTARNDAATARNDAMTAENDAKIAMMEEEIGRMAEENARMSEENAILATRCGRLVTRSAKLEVRNDIMQVLVHTAKGDKIQVAMWKAGLRYDPFRARQILQAHNAIYCIYRAGRHPSHEEYEEILEEAGFYEGLPVPPPSLADLV